MRSQIDPSRNVTRKISFQIIETLKGDLSSEVTVLTQKNSSSCGYLFEIGKEYLVYAYGKKGDYGAGLCSRTQALSGNGQKEFDLLKKSPKPFKFNKELIPSFGFYKLGLKAYLEGNKELARKKWEEALEKDPDNIEAARGLKRLDGIPVEGSNKPYDLD